MDFSESELRIDCDSSSIAASLSLPPDCRGVVLFAHGSGSDRHSPRNRWVARALLQHGIGTVLMDLESAIERSASNTGLGSLSRRFVVAMEWAHSDHRTAHLPLGLFGASSGAAVAIRAAVECRVKTTAIVLRGGRPDLAAEFLPELRAPTLMIVGERDVEVHAINQRAAQCMTCEHELAVVYDATHLFAEPGALETVANLAGSWYVEHFERGSEVATDGGWGQPQGRAHDVKLQASWDGWNP